MDRDDRVLAIHLARQHRADFGSLDVTSVALESSLEVGNDVLALLGPIEQHMKIVRLFAKRLGDGPVVFEPAAALLSFLCVRGVLPEVGRGDRGFDFGQFALKAGFVKAPSEGRSRGP
jgi:hypothetical protein